MIRARSRPWGQRPIEERPGAPPTPEFPNTILPGIVNEATGLFGELRLRDVSNRPIIVELHRNSPPIETRIDLAAGVM